MTDRTMYDASQPPAKPPVTDVVAFYGGGDTPHVWTPAEVDAQPARWRLPIFVRSNPPGPGAPADVEAFVAYLASIGCPRGAATSLDLETAIDPGYVDDFGQGMGAAGFSVLPYGSSGYLFSNPALGGYWVAEPGAQSIPGNCVAVQYLEDAGGGAYDLSFIRSTVPLWDTRPTPAPSGGNDMISATASGEGYACVQPDGAVFAFGDANYHGGPNAGQAGSTMQPNDTATGIALRTQNDGYWVTTASGAVFAYGAAEYLGAPNNPKR